MSSALVFATAVAFPRDDVVVFAETVERIRLSALYSGLFRTIDAQATLDGRKVKDLGWSWLKRFISAKQHSASTGV